MNRGDFLKTLLGAPLVAKALAEKKYDAPKIKPETLVKTEYVFTTGNWGHYKIQNWDDVKP